MSDITPEQEEYKQISKTEKNDIKKTKPKRIQKDLIGVDVFLDWSFGTAEDLGSLISSIETDKFEFLMISVSGVKVWPCEIPDTTLDNNWCCRFFAKRKGEIIKHSHIIELLNKINDSGFDFVKIENLYNIDGVPGYTLMQEQ
jgi:isocitrate dehydrogenase